ncbi:MAG: hypothetical protein IJD04_05960 [Desulfovibrionaceae bacterium]|nr:hypothetical protein [Desulfovibrionaceae bacterium]
MLETTIKIEVSSCTSHSDKTQPSSSLIEANNIVKELFDESEFDGCQQEGFESFATYIVPAEVGTLSGEEMREYTPGGISLIRVEGADKSAAVLFMLSGEIRERIQMQNKDAFSNDFKFHANIRLSNNTDAELIVFPNSVYIDKLPYAYPPSGDVSLAIPAKESVNIELSDVSSDFLIMHGTAFLYFEKGI